MTVSGCHCRRPKPATVKRHIKKAKVAHRVPKLIPVLGSQHACEMSHNPGGKLPLLSVRPAVTLATLKRAATNLAAW